MRLQELTEFRNEPLTDFSQDANRQAMEAALAEVRSEFGFTVPLIVGGEEVYTDDTFPSLNPSNPSQVLAQVSKGTKELADRAVQVANEAFQRWKKVPAAERADYLFKAAEGMRERKHYFSAWMVYEVGKSWPEADADTAEAIDFLEYYARQMIRLEETATSQLTQIPGERAELRYIPLGVGAVIPPWNFPSAILTGMTSAAIVAGNAVVLKPASTSPIIGYQVARLFHEVGLPGGVLNFLPGPGGTIGDTLVDHPLTRFVAFTGSKEVGLRIFERAGRAASGQRWLKRTILEMGGKDAVLVDETADLEKAAAAVVVSAFGFQGQKCSAGSRAIIVKDVYDTMVEKVVDRTRNLTVGDPSDPENWMGPVVDDKAFKKIRDYIEIGKQEGELIYGGDVVAEDGGYFIEPTIIKDVPPDARIAQEEIFGPVLAIIKAQDFDDALEIANSTEYGLTGALFSQDPERIERAKEEFHVGNLYFNRKCTGALVGVHPFGGFNMSGTDSKAGGPDYLLLFTQAKSVSAKTS
ncbi:MAG TPA: L-glutamate gamma-semialdehyde dehydrogenase [Chloroflexi bacterium]|nr:L-glutamate gamma-semialdehyde dehydrogenase [Chloroflexota bacterium]